MTREELVTERLKIFTDRISPTLQIFSSMFATALGKQLARGDDLEPTFSAMDTIVLFIAESADYRRRHRRVPDTTMLPVEMRLTELVLHVIHDCLPMRIEKGA
jgi:hypothetical protein